MSYLSYSTGYISKNNKVSQCKAHHGVFLLKILKVDQTLSRKGSAPQSLKANQQQLCVSASLLGYIRHLLLVTLVLPTAALLLRGIIKANK